MASSTAIGIDLGTTNSCVAVMRNGKVEIIANDMGHRITPSCVAFNEDGRLIGDAAKCQAECNPKSTIFNAKRYIGRKYEELDQATLKTLPFEVVDIGGLPSFKVEYKNRDMLLTPVEISSMVLAYMKNVAETYIGSEVKEAVITVPAYFTDSQRQGTLDAGKVAGLNVLSIINEPTAAALAYNIETHPGNQNILIYDFGGGTFDVAILNVSNSRTDVLVVNGDTNLGGSDVDSRLVDYFVDDLKKTKGMHLTDNHRALAKLRKASEEAKCYLSSKVTVRQPICVDSVYNGIDYSTALSKARLEKMCTDLFEKTMDCVDRALHDAELDAYQIDEVILVGGSSRIPKIHELLKKKFPGKTLNQNINPDEAVAYGAALRAASLCRGKSVVDITLTDVTPLTLGINVIGGKMNKIIPRNTRIPTAKTKVYKTTVDYQEGLDLKMYEGERPKSAENHFLGEFSLEGIAPALKGKTLIEVNFSIDKNSILTVSAHEPKSGMKSSLVVRSNKGNLKPGELMRMMEEAEEFKKDDTEQSMNLNLIQKIEELCLDIQSVLPRDQKMYSPKARSLENACDEVQIWLERNPRATAEEYKNQFIMLNDLKERSSMK